MTISTSPSPTIMRVLVFSAKRLTQTLMILAWVSLTSSSLFADLSWEKTVIEHEAATDETHFATALIFKNTGSAPITIESIETSCSCTTAIMEKKTYAPNEIGKLQIDFAVGGQTGAQEKTILVKTNEAADATSTLTLRVKIPSPLRVSSPFLFWNVGEAPAEKSVVVTLNPAARGELSLPVPLPKGFKVGLANSTPAGTYLLNIRPDSTDTPSDSVVKLQLERPNFAPLVVAIHTQVR